MDKAPALLRFWREYMPEAPDELQCMPLIFNTPDGDTVFSLFPLYAGDPITGEEAIAPLREVEKPLSDDIGLVPYANLLSELDEMYRSGDRNYCRSAFLDTLPDEAIEALLDRSTPIPSPFTSIFLEPMGGAIARKDIQTTAFPHRKRNFCVTAVPKWEDENRDEEMKAWADHLFDALEPYRAKGIYVNYLDNIDHYSSKDAYGQNWNRLRQLKKKWDPENLFNINHNIPPSD